ncbi:MAG: hypothetical protein HGA87_05820, partial [Desulfobulbaceae bacterium]|nr:hypothetical protein [Desulfobulbaceae bacterium]
MSDLGANSKGNMITPVVNLPSMMLSQEPADDQAPLAAAPVVVIDGPEFDPEKYLDDETIAKIRDFVQKNVRSDRFDHEFLMQVIQEFNAGDTPDMDAMLEGIRLQKFADYFGGAPHLDQIHFSIYPGGNIEEVLSDFQNGKIEEMPAYGQIRQKLVEHKNLQWVHRPSLSI